MSLLAAYNVSSVHLVVSGAESASRVEAWVAQRFSESMPGISVAVVPEDAGTADALRQVLPLLPKSVTDLIILSSDVICHLSLGALAAFHRLRGSSLTMVVQDRSSAGANPQDASSSRGSGGAGSSGGGTGGGGKRGSGSSASGGSGGSGSGPGKAAKRPEDLFVLGSGENHQRLLSFWPGASAPRKELRVPQSLVDAWGSVDVRTDLSEVGVLAVKRATLEQALLARPSASSFAHDVVPGMVRAQSLPPAPLWVKRLAEMEVPAAAAAAAAGHHEAEGTAAAAGEAGGGSKIEAGERQAHGSEAEEEASGQRGVPIKQSGSSALQAKSTEPTAGSLTSSSSYTHSASSLLAPLPVNFSSHAASSKAGHIPLAALHIAAPLAADDHGPCFVFLLPELAYSGIVDSGRALFDANLALLAQPLALPWASPSNGHAPLIHDSVTTGAKATIGQGSAVGEGTSLGDKCSVKKSIVGRHCQLAGQVKIVNSVIMDHVVIGEGCVVTSSVLGNNVTLQPHTSVTDCFVGPGFLVSKYYKEEELSRESLGPLP